MRYNSYDPDYERFLLCEQQRLTREVTGQKMSWRKLGKVIQLNALIRMRER